MFDTPLGLTRDVWLHTLNDMLAFSLHLWSKRRLLLPDLFRRYGPSDRAWEDCGHLMCEMQDESVSAPFRRDHNLNASNVSEMPKEHLLYLEESIDVTHALRFLRNNTFSLSSLSDAFQFKII